MKKITLGVLSLALMATASVASAATTTGSFQVAADVKGSCVITQVTSLYFAGDDGSGYDSGKVSDTTQMSSVNVKCTAGSSNVKVVLDQGTFAADSSSCVTPLRRLKWDDGDKYLSYAVYQDSRYRNVFGCDQSNVKVMNTFASSLESVRVDLWGVIPAGQDAMMGIYRDTLGVNVTF